MFMTKTCPHCGRFVDVVWEGRIPTAQEEGLPPAILVYPASVKLRKGAFSGTVGPHTDILSQSSWKASMKIMAIDLAVKKSGWALIDGDVTQDGVVVAPALPRHGSNRSKPSRNLKLLEKFSSLPWDGVTDVIIERPHRWMRVKRRMSTAAVDAMIGVRHILELAVVCNSQAEIHYVDPNEWQSAMIAGYPGDTKEASVFRAREETGIDFPHDVADAVCMGLWWLKQWERRIEK